jgi:hypothetical protein
MLKYNINRYVVKQDENFRHSEVPYATVEFRCSSLLLAWTSSGKGSRLQKATSRDNPSPQIKAGSLAFPSEEVNLLIPL